LIGYQRVPSGFIFPLANVQVAAIRLLHLKCAIRSPSPHHLLLNHAPPLGMRSLLELSPLSSVQSHISVFEYPHYTVSALQDTVDETVFDPQHYRPRGPQRDFIYPRPVQSLPPLRAFLRNEGIDTDIEPRQQRLVSATHEVAREEARRRAIRATATRYVFLEHTEASSHFPLLLKN
jgi:hypothetical protein